MAEDWLRRAGRTVVYFGRDFNADEYYLRQTLPHITPPQQWLARHWLARIRAVELQARLNSTPTNAFCEWFYLQVDQPATEATIGGGSWADQLTSHGPWPLRSRLLPPQRRYRSRQPANLTAPTQTNPLTPLLAPSEDDPQGEVARSRWRPDEFDTLEAWNAAFRQLLRSEVLLESDTGEPLVFRLTGRQRLGDGQIIVVANGAPFLNASLVEPLFFDVGALIIEQCMPASRVALLTYDAQGLLISQVAEAGRMAGLEMFTQWPLSAIMLPAALLGLILCAYLFPTLGRPLGVAERSVRDFGLHVDALRADAARIRRSRVCTAGDRRLFSDGPGRATSPLADGYRCHATAHDNAEGQMTTGLPNMRRTITHCPQCISQWAPWA